jgi:HlyD family secretion protein
MAGTEMMRISDLSRMEVRVDVNENDIVRIDVGDSAGIEVDAYLGKTFRGIVTQVANSAKSSTAMSTDQVTKYEVKILILRSSYEAMMNENNGKMPFRPGMSSTVHVYTKQEVSILAVPVSSITMKEKKDKPEEKEEVVFIVENGKAVQKAIKTGIQDTKYIKIIEGIKPGVMVITAPYEAINLKIKDGIAVKVVDKEILYEEKN